MKIKRYIFNRM